MARIRIPHSRSVAFSIAALAFLITFAPQAGAQRYQHGEHNTDACCDSSTTNALVDWFSRGSFGGLWRTQAMGTFHQAPLSDNWASGTAFRLHYHTAEFRGWYVSVVGQFGYALASSDLSGVDELTGQRARFELHMFDIEDPTNRKDFDRLENLTLTKRFEHGEIVGGRFSFDSPFVNEQDTRLKANAFSGFTGHYSIGKKHNHDFIGAYIYGISPRGTIKWFNLGASLGLLDNGLRPDGAEADYHGHLSTPGMFIAGWSHETDHFSSEAWHYHTDGIFSHSFARATQDFGKAKDWNIGVEGLYQQKLGNGGSETYENRYYYNDQPAILLGGRLRHERAKVGFELAGLSAVGEGTYLFPREWGRERFFTSVPRARVEGLGKFTEISAQFDTKIRENVLMLLTLAYLDVPSLENPLHNKYSLVDHYLLNGELQIDGRKFMRNTSFRFIAAAHVPADNTYTPEELYYKAEFVHFSLQMDMHF